jgi:signal transduction histidine kinase
MLERFYDIVAGPADEFKVENRILNLICFFGIILDLIGGVLNSLLYNANDNYSFWIAAVSTGFIYYLTRFKKLYKLAVPLLVLLCYLVVVATYIFNNGSQGAILLTSSMVFVFLIAIIGRKYHGVVVAIHILVFLTLGYIEWSNPSLIQDNYVNEQSRLIDIMTVFMVSTIVVAFTLVFLRKALDEQRYQTLRKNLELTQSQEQLKRVFSVISHDLRNPLINIQSYLEVLENADLPDDHRQALKQELLRSVKSTTAMLDQTLQWSKSQIHNEKAQLQHVQVTEIMQAAVDQVSPFAEQKGVHIDWEECGCVIHSDPNQMIIILRNLLHNALKYSEKGQTVRVYSRTSNDKCRIYVEDHGEGMTEKQVKSLFTTDTRSRKGTEKEHGAGIGLLLCKQLASLNSAEIQVESSVGEGSTFTLVLNDAEVVACEHV